MRVLLLNHNIAWSGGTFFRAYHIGRYLVRRGHDVTLMTISKHNFLKFQSERVDGLEVVYTPDLFWGIGRTGWDTWDMIWDMEKGLLEDIVGALLGTNAQ